MRQIVKISREFILDDHIPISHDLSKSIIIDMERRNLIIIVTPHNVILRVDHFTSGGGGGGWVILKKIPCTWVLKRDS